MKVKALKKFETIKDLERDVFPKEGEVWEVSAERADLLLKHGVVELVKEKVEAEDTKEESLEEKPKKKKTNKK